jgi:hypothetical protein
MTSLAVTDPSAAVPDSIPADPYQGEGQGIFPDIAADPNWTGRVLQAAAGREPLCRMTLGIAHEANNLVGGISALSEIYLQGRQGSLPLNEGMALIHNSAGRLQAIIRQLVELSRSPDGERTCVGIVELVRNQLDLFAHILPKGARIRTHFPDEELAVHLDETAFRQLLLNLVVNVHDATGKTTSREEISPVILSLRQLPDAPPRVELLISPHLDGAVDASPAAAPDATEMRRQDVRLRLLDARQRMAELGGELDVRAGGEVALILPLVLF